MTPIGPFDHRKRRHRCDACTKSHWKCSGESPCTQCAKRNQPCRYPIAGQTSSPILVDRGEQRTVGSYTKKLGRDSQAVFDTRLVRPPAVSDPTQLYFSHYDAFFESNRFTGLSRVDDVKQLMCKDSKAKTAYYQSALKLYTGAIVDLRRALCQFNGRTETQSRAGILWTTLLLGLFELITDPSGDSWLQHLVHGTSQALMAGGPSACISGPCSRFFAESKVFEVCRAIVFNRPTFLADEEWLSLSASLRASSNWSTAQQRLDALLDMVVMCSSLRVRYVRMPCAATPGLVERAEAISLQGFALRSQLQVWSSSYHTCPALLGTISDTTADASVAKPLPDELQPQILAEKTVPAASIYLSGVFNYEIGYWQGLHLPAPALGEHEIQQHVSLILASSQRLVRETSLSPLLLLFPLGVASARAQTVEQRRGIMELLALVGARFAVAKAIVADVEELWRYRDAMMTVECG
ncbi:uncharacterized protein B0T15DRAFT_554596 [Chaetomium strumarium]|uniref:Zn(2)-C6 fungal-type domain-containing protein n=1 Tax=Chaetomium strumarium TaxID=1170767 RepID=A0AAJ0GX19_9PEZI|nr:hypothetical protein B0T15DRAFT_554596 [Chaetomium strumarium]